MNLENTAQREREIRPSPYCHTHTRAPLIDSLGALAFPPHNCIYVLFLLFSLIHTCERSAMCYDTHSIFTTDFSKIDVNFGQFAERVAFLCVNRPVDFLVFLVWIASWEIEYANKCCVLSVCDTDVVYRAKEKYTMNGIEANDFAVSAKQYARRAANDADRKYTLRTSVSEENIQFSSSRFRKTATLIWISGESRQILVVLFEFRILLIFIRN